MNASDNSAEVEPFFNDILQQRRNQSDISWITRIFRPKPAYAGPHTSVNPLVFRYKVLMDSAIILIMQQEYPNESASHHFQRIDDMVQEIGYLKSLSVVRWLGFILIKIMKKVLQSVLVNESKLLKIRSTMGTNPIVFVPSHRSYADFILMALVSFNYDIDIPVVVAAMDFHAMFGMASLLRQCGAMYMRRSFKNDRVYRAVFKKYVQTVLAEGRSPFEFFIEGGRSRSGKSLMPKFGILKMIVEVYLNRTVEDITFVPISINFDRLLEDSLFVREMIGIPKPKESTTGLLRSVSLLEEQYGNIYINVGDGISLKDLHSNSEDDEFLPILAHTIVKKQQNNTVLTYFNVLSSVIISRLMVENTDSLPICELVEGVTNLKNILIAFGACINWPNDERALKRILSIQKTLTTIDQNQKFIRLPYISDYDTIHKDILNTVKSLMLLQMYSNPCYHFLVNPAILVVILRTEIQLNKDQLFLKYNLFRRLFKHEFVFYEAFVVQDFHDACNTLRSLNVLETAPNDAFKLISGEDVIWFNLMIPYLRGYLFVYQSLSQFSSRTLARSKLTTRIRKQLEVELEVSNDLGSFYGLSSDLISCACSSLSDAGILHIEGSNGNNLIVSSPDRLKGAESFLNHLLGRYDSSIPLSIISGICKL